MALLSEYGFNEGSGTTANDTSGNARHITVNSARWTATGKNGAGVVGPSTAVDVVCGPTGNGQALTFMFWAKANDLDGATMVEIVRGGDKINVWTYQGLVGVGLNGSDYAQLDVGADTWHHLCVSITAAGALTFFVDGVSRGTGGPGGNWTASRVWIGQNEVGADLLNPGTIDELRFFNESMNAATVTTWMNTPITPATGPVARTATGTLTLSGVGQRQVPQLFLTSVSGKTPLDQNGNPWQLSGFTGWAATANLNPSEFAQYVNLVSGAGFNAICIAPPVPWIGDGGTPYATIDGVAFFGAGPNFSSPNETYWARVDQFITLCENAGMTVFFAYCDSDMDAALYAAGSSVWTTYGNFLANRYGARPNIVWQHWFDSSGHDDMYAAIAARIEAIAPGSLHTFHQPASLENISLGSENASLSPYVNLDGVYYYGSPYRAFERPEAIASPLPLIFYEGLYEGGTSNESGGATGTAEVVRRLTGWSLASGSMGDFFGVQAGWWPRHFAGANWPTAIITATAVDTVHLRTGARSAPWWKLRTNSAFITSGLGTDALSPATSTRAAASVATDGTAAMVYVPTSRAMTVNLGLLNSSPTAVKVDPMSGATSSLTITGGNIAAQGNNSGGGGDWLYVFSAAAAAEIRTATGTLTITGTATRTVRLTRTATGTLTLSGTSPSTARLTRTATGTLTLSGATTQVARLTRTAEGALTLSGTAPRTIQLTRTATGTLTLSGSAVGDIVGTNQERDADGVLTLSGTATHTVRLTRTANGSLTLTGSATGVERASRTATGTLTLSGEVVRVIKHTRTAVGQLDLSGTAVRVSEGQTVSAWVDGQERAVTITLMMDGVEHPVTLSMFMDGVEN